MELLMRLTLLTLAAAIGCFPAPAGAIPFQGSKITVEGTAHVEREASGVRVYLGGSMIGFVPFDYKSNFPGLFQFDGHQLQVTGVVNRQSRITLTDPEQVKVID